MHRPIVFLLFLYTMVSPGYSQENEAILRVAVVDQVDTQKRHNSVWFTFGVKEVYSGIVRDTLIPVQEIYNDFGASNIRRKLRPDWHRNGCTDSSEPNELVIKVRETEASYTLIWVARPHRYRSLQRLEGFLASRGTDLSYELLNEESGKLWLMESDLPKVAVETPSGAWVMALLEDYR